MNSYLDLYDIDITPSGLKLGVLTQSYFELPNFCPHCLKSIQPAHLISASSDDIVNKVIPSIFLCTNCDSYFFTLHNMVEDDEEKLPLIRILPTPSSTIKFSDAINNLSPNFVKIYTDSNKAENDGLNTICGMGYRKALEFLIKDYAIHNHPDDSETISNSMLSQCINNYCENERIKTLAKACSWIGNDETHYVRKNNDYSIYDLKKFIDVIVAYIEQEVILEQATTLLINHKKD